MTINRLLTRMGVCQLFYRLIHCGLGIYLESNSVVPFQGSDTMATGPDLFWLLLLKKLECDRKQYDI